MRAAVAAIPPLLPPSIPFLTVPAVDGRVIAFAVGLALAAATLLAGWPVARLLAAAAIVPARRAARVDPVEALRAD